MPQSEGGGGSNIKGPTEADSLDSRYVDAVAASLGISPAQAESLIRQYHTGGRTWQEAANMAYERGAASGGTGTSGDGSGSGGSSSGGSGGGSSGGGGGSSAPQGPDPQDVKNAVESYVTMFQGWGIPVTGQMRGWLKRQVLKGANSAAVLAAFRKTKDYARAFPGLVRRDGTMRMTEAQYLAGFRAANDFAASVGRTFSMKAYGQALKNGNSPTEIKAKIEALDILKTNRSMFEEFSGYLQATGLTNNPLNKKQLRQFIMKQGPKEWEEAWETANDAAALEKLDVSVGPGDDVGYKELARLRNQMLPGQEVDYGALADMGSKLGAARLYGFGVTKKDLVDMAYGTKRAPKIAERVKLALGTWQATASEQRAAPMLTAQGLGAGQPHRQATE